ncbi:MAG: hypothetical protein OXN17_17125 [Candidatus Poribacteria bacterium]|nr:hypothetical protein [Candidatus Poribacteria bacterium]
MQGVWVILTIMFLLIGIQSSEGFRENIVRGWLFDDGSGKTAKDASGNGNDGSTYVQIPFSNSLVVLNQGDFTLAAWFASENLPLDSDDCCAAVFQQRRTWLFLHRDSGEEIKSFIGGDLTFSRVHIKETGKWRHAAVVVKEVADQDQIQIYVNGKAEGFPNAIGMEDEKPDIDNFIGLIDEVVLINKALSYL